MFTCRRLGDLISHTHQYGNLPAFNYNEKNVCCKIPVAFSYDIFLAARTRRGSAALGRRPGECHLSCPRCYFSSIGDISEALASILNIINHLGRSSTVPKRSSTSQRTGQLVGSVASLLAQGVLQGSASDISNTVSELLDVLLIRRRNSTDSVWTK